MKPKKIFIVEFDKMTRKDRNRTKRRKSTPRDPELYEEVKQKVIRDQPQTSVYRSMRIQKEYKEAYALQHGEKGDPYVGRNFSKSRGTERWLDEEWINVRTWIETGKRVPCGSTASTGRYATCRPWKRINSGTPTTLRELVKKGITKRAIKNAIKKKEKNPKVRIVWENLGE
jgi:hypothetical protein